jgi:predicted PurR-regulated permease PerM
MEELELSQKPKKRIVLKSILFLSLILIVMVFLVYMINYDEYKKGNEAIIVNQIREIVQQQTGQDISVKDVTKPDPSIKNPLTKVNPRWSFINSSDSEVAYITHIGDIGGIGNLTFNITSTGGGYGFFCLHRDFYKKNYKRMVYRHRCFWNNQYNQFNCYNYI